MRRGKSSPAPPPVKSAFPEELQVICRRSPQLEPGRPGLPQPACEPLFPDLIGLESKLAASPSAGRGDPHRTERSDWAGRLQLYWQHRQHRDADCIRLHLGNDGRRLRRQALRRRVRPSSPRRFKRGGHRGDEVCCAALPFCSETDETPESPASGWPFAVLQKPPGELTKCQPDKRPPAPDARIPQLVAGRSAFCRRTRKIAPRVSPAPANTSARWWPPTGMVETIIVTFKTRIKLMSQRVSRAA